MAPSREPGRPAARLCALFAAAVFLLLLSRPVYTRWLRADLRRSAPESWAKLPMSGGYATLLPQLFINRWHDEALFAARVNQILLHGRSVNPYWREDRGDRSWLHACLPAYLVAAVAFACGGDLNLAWDLSVALIGVLWFLLFRGVFLWASGRDSVAIPLALFSVAFPDLYVYFLDVNVSPRVNWDRLNSMFFQEHAAVLPRFRRLPNLNLTVLLLSGAVAATWRLVAGRGGVVKAALVGAAYGLLAFAHLYEATFGLGILVAFAALAWRMEGDRAPRRDLLVAVAGALAVMGAGFLLLSSGDPAAKRDMLEMMGAEYMRRPYKTTILHLLVGGWCLRQASREPEPGGRYAWLLLAAAQASAFVGRNAQVVPGVTVIPAHYITLGSFMGCLAALLALARLLGRAAWWDRRVAAAAIAGILALALSNEKALAERTFTMTGKPPDVEQALDWLKASTPKDTLVLTLSIEATEMLALYTGAKTVAAPASPPGVGVFTKDYFLGRVARLLKTLDADGERFLAERWLTPSEKGPVIGRMDVELRHLARVDREAFEQAEWFYPYIQANQSDAPILAGRRRVLELMKTLPPVAPPYYAWIGASDRRYLRKAPAALGGKLAFRNDTVELWRFD
ncbi:MAG: hypothetical protein HY554_11290 [Elusimicrobia bacterium]|nr:hypothetical protein [Elusimicrobiota bacterium]